MNKKGFTLIELLAVILILGIIALIAVPTVANLIKEGRKNTFKTTVKNVVRAVEQKCQIQRMKGEKVTDLYTFTEDGVFPSLEVSGGLPVSGSIALDEECNTVASVYDGHFTIVKNLNDDYTTKDEKKSIEYIFIPQSTETKNVAINLYSQNNEEASITEVFELDEKNNVLVIYAGLVLDNTYDTRSEAYEVAENFEYDGKTANSKYYITDKYIYILEGMTVTSEMQEQMNTFYAQVESIRASEGLTMKKTILEY